MYEDADGRPRPGSPNDGDASPQADTEDPGPSYNSVVKLTADHCRQELPQPITVEEVPAYVTPKAMLTDVESQFPSWWKRRLREIRESS